MISVLYQWRFNGEDSKGNMTNKAAFCKVVYVLANVVDNTKTIPTEEEEPFYKMSSFGIGCPLS